MKKRIVSFLTAIVFLFSISVYGNAAFAVGENENTSSLSDKRAEVEKKLKDIDSELEKLGAQSKETEEYIQALDKKIKYLSEQYNLAKNEVKTLEKRKLQLESSIDVNEKELKHIKKDVKRLEGEIRELNKDFEETYELYCKRVRAIYVSGSVNTTISFLFEGSLQDFLTRLEMVSSVSKRDGELMKSVQNQTAQIIDKRESLNKKNKDLKEKQVTLKEDKASLKTKKVELLEKEESLQKQQGVIEEQQLKANESLKKLHAKTKEYGEYRDITAEELDAIDSDIEEADRRYRETTTTTTTTTTAAPSETEKTKKKGKTTTTTSTTSTTKKNTQDTIRLTYPVPAYTTITCGFGAYEGHTGCDFSTRRNQNQRVVAAESGTVILVKMLETSYGHYVVIRHDKLTPSGKTVYTLYAHNNDIIVSAGMYVKKGQQIAFSGTTGNSTGPHCHFEVRVGGSSQGCAVDPAAYLP